MTARPVFGQTEPPPVSKERMCYVARAGCGHIVIAQADSRPSSLTDFVAEGLSGLTLDRIPSEQVRTGGLLHLSTASPDGCRAVNWPGSAEGC